MIRAGLGSSEITPPLGVELSGYGPFLRRRATRVLLPLQARAVAVDDGLHRWIIVACDLLGLDEALDDRTREAVSTTIGWPIAEVVVHATHSHSAPATIRDFRGWGAVDELYAAQLPDAIAQACRRAVDDLGPAVLRVGFAPLEGFARDRTSSSADPSSLDAGVDVIRIDRNGVLHGFVARYSCHPVVCGPTTSAVHGDYPAFALAELEAERPGTVGVFLQGALGDIDPIFAHGPEEESYAQVEAYGHRLAEAIATAMDASEPDPCELVRIARQEVEVELPQPDADDLARELARERARLAGGGLAERDDEAAAAAAVVPNLERLLWGAAAGVRFARRLQLCALQAGSTVIATANLELFHAVHESLRQRHGTAVWTVSTTGPYAGYCPSPDAFAATALPYAAHRVPLYLGMPPYPTDIASLVAARLSNLIDVLEHTTEKQA